MRLAILTVSPTTSSGRNSTSPVDTGPHLHTQVLCLRDDLDGSAYSPCGRIEGGEEPVADGFDFTASMPLQEGAHHSVVLVGERVPPAMPVRADSSVDATMSVKRMVAVTTSPSGA